MKPALVIAASVLLFSLGVQAQSPALKAGEDGQLLKDGKPYRALGINYFSCFLRTLENGEDTSYDEGFRVLAEHKIPFARFAATGFWKPTRRPRPISSHRKMRATFSSGEPRSRFFKASCHSAPRNSPALDLKNFMNRTTSWLIPVKHPF